MRRGSFRLPAPAMGQHRRCPSGRCRQKTTDRAGRRLYQAIQARRPFRQTSRHRLSRGRTAVTTSHAGQIDIERIFYAGRYFKRRLFGAGANITDKHRNSAYYRAITARHHNANHGLIASFIVPLIFVFSACYAMRELAFIASRLSGRITLPFPCQGDKLDMTRKVAIYASMTYHRNILMRFLILH